MGWKFQNRGFAIITFSPLDGVFLFFPDFLFIQKRVLVNLEFYIIQ